MLLERGELLDSLRGRLDQARDGTSGSLVLLAGEAGAGKTSLVKEFVAGVGERVLTLQGACDPLATPRPLSPLLDFAADPDSGLTDLFEMGGDNIALFGRLHERLRHTIRPIVLVVEDIHWADQATLDFLRFLGRRVERTKAVAICTYRDDEVGPDHPVTAAIGGLTPLQTTFRFEVPPLTLQGVSSLVGDRDIDVSHLHAITGGNPFFVTEVLAGAGGIPASVQDATLARVVRLDQRSRQVIEAVSIAPRFLHVRHINGLIGADTDEVDAALASGVVEGERNTLRFRHELARAAIEASIPPARARKLHLAMTQILLAEPDLDLARLVHHAMRADEPDLIIAYSPEAARQASKTGAHRQAIEFYEAALALETMLLPEEASLLRLELANELGTVGRKADAFAHLDRAIQHLRQTNNGEALIEALVPPTSARWQFEDSHRLRVRLAEALARLEHSGTPTQRVKAHVASAYQFMLSRRAQDARRDLDQARELVHLVDEPQLSWMVGMLEATVSIVMGDVERGISDLHELRSSAAEGGRTSDEVLALMMLGTGSGEARRYDAAVPALQECIDRALRIDQDYLASYARAWLARIAFENCEWHQVGELARLAVSMTNDTTGIAHLTAQSAVGRAAVRSGDPGGKALLDQLVELGEGHELQHVWNAVCGAAENSWLVGDTEGMVRTLKPAYRRALETDSQWARGEIGYWMWKAGAIQEVPGPVAEPYRLQMSGEYRAAARAWDALGCPFEVGLSLSEGDRASMIESLRIFDRLGARPVGALIRSRLRDQGVKGVPRGPTRSTSSSPANLTARQTQVLRLLLSGLSNSEIADTLYISRKTAEHHVSAIYRKLGVESRAEAMAVAREIGIQPTPEI